MYIQFNVHVYIFGGSFTTLHVFLTAQCKPGEYSVSGLVPCTPCSRSTYQPQSMSSTCLVCPQGKTSKPGSTMLSECKGKTIISAWRVRCFTLISLKTKYLLWHAIFWSWNIWILFRIYQYKVRRCVILVFVVVDELSLLFCRFWCCF